MTRKVSISSVCSPLSILKSFRILGLRILCFHFPPGSANPVVSFQMHKFQAAPRPATQNLQRCPSVCALIAGTANTEPSFSAGVLCVWLGRLQVNLVHFPKLHTQTDQYYGSAEVPQESWVDGIHFWNYSELGDSTCL